MEAFTVELGGAERVLKYTIKERREMEKRFGCSLLDLMIKRAFPYDDKGNPTGAGEWEPQMALLYYGLRHAGKSMTESKVEEWVTDAINHERNVHEFVITCVAAIFASGVLGFIKDFRAKPEDEEPGKAESAEAPS